VIAEQKLSMNHGVKHHDVISQIFIGKISLCQMRRHVFSSDLCQIDDGLAQK
jgi:hypothetical protein